MQPWSRCLCFQALSYVYVMCACLCTGLSLQEVAFSLSLIVKPDLHTTGTIVVVSRDSTLHR